MNESQPIPAAVRPVTEDDWAALRTARLAALAEAPYAFSSTIAREQELSEGAWRARIRDSATFAAWQGEVIVGTVTGLSRADPSLWNLVAMWVSPDWRGTGIADDLVSAVCERARTSGAVRIGLWVTDINARARAFYGRLGFEPTGDRQLVRPDEPDHWETLLARSL
jgi:GNAT superfamily N-acetyltransferase